MDGFSGWARRRVALWSAQPVLMCTLGSMHTHIRTHTHIYTHVRARSHACTHRLQPQVMRWRLPKRNACELGAPTAVGGDHSTSPRSRTPLPQQIECCCFYSTTAQVAPRSPVQLPLIFLSAPGPRCENPPCCWLFPPPIPSLGCCCCGSSSVLH